MLTDLRVVQRRFHLFDCCDHAFALVDHFSFLAKPHVSSCKLQMLHLGQFHVPRHLAQVIVESLRKRREELVTVLAHAIIDSERSVFTRDSLESRS